MRIIAVEKDNQGELSEMLLKAYPRDTVISFTDPLFAIKDCCNIPAQMIICQNTLKHLDGVFLIKLLRQKFPKIKAVLVYNEEDKEGYKEEYYADDEILCITGPATVENLNNVLKI